VLPRGRRRLALHGGSRKTLCSSRETRVMHPAGCRGTAPRSGWGHVHVDRGGVDLQEQDVSREPIVMQPQSVPAASRAKQLVAHYAVNEDNTSPQRVRSAYVGGA